MLLFSVRGVEIRLHPLLLPVAAGALVLGLLDELLTAILALTLHETSHAIVADVFGCPMLSLELMPFGGVARLGRNRLMPYAELTIAAAGPVTSLVAAGVAAACICALERTMPTARMFLSFNLTLAALNLLPVLPLDGGRMLRGYLCGRIPERQLTRAMCFAGMAVGLLLSGLSALSFARGAYNLTLPVMGVFLLLAAIAELRRAPERRLRDFVLKNESVRAGGSLPVHELAAHEAMCAREALRTLRTNRFNVLRVVDSGMHTVGELDEGDLLLGMARCGNGVTVGEILAFDRCGRI